MAPLAAYSLAPVQFAAVESLTGESHQAQPSQLPGARVYATTQARDLSEDDAGSNLAQARLDFVPFGSRPSLATTDSISQPTAGAEENWKHAPAESPVRNVENIGSVSANSPANIGRAESAAPETSVVDSRSESASPLLPSATGLSSASLTFKLEDYSSPVANTAFVSPREQQSGLEAGTNLPTDASTGRRDLAKPEAPQHSSGSEHSVASSSSLSQASEAGPNHSGAAVASQDAGPAHPASLLSSQFSSTTILQAPLGASDFTGHTDRSTLLNSDEPSRNPFLSMDGEGAVPNQVSSASEAGQLVVGHQDPTLGYIELRAHSDGGAVHASLGAQSAATGETLEGHLGALESWMNERHIPVESLTVVGLHSPSESRPSFNEKDTLPNGSSSGHGGETNAGSGRSGDSGNSGQRSDSGSAPRRPTIESQAPVAVASRSTVSAIPAAHTLSSGRNISVLA
jgi:hypothetical protein